MLCLQIVKEFEVVYVNEILWFMIQYIYLGVKYSACVILAVSSYSMHYQLEDLDAT